MRRRTRLAAAAGVLACLALLQGCGKKTGCVVDYTYQPQIDPAAFQGVVDNEYYPLVPGTVFVYAEGADTVRVEVLADTTKIILGVACTVVHDQVFQGAELTEDTYDWFAQDTLGTVWYFGEDTREMAGGVVVSTEGSWEAGVDRAKPGIIIPGDPAVGMAYRQEYHACQAEDMGEILALDASAAVPYGSFADCLKTRDFTPLDPDVEENKYYAPGVGLVLTVDTVTGAREELVRVLTR